MNTIITWIKANAGLSILLGVAVIAIIVAIKNATTGGGNDSKDLATCLKRKGAKFYGTKSCPYCQQQKSFFPNPENLPYIECTTSQEECQKANLSGFPTWIFPNGKRVTGAQSLEQLKQLAGC